MHAVVALSCLMCAVVALRTLILCCCCSPHPYTVRSATIHCYRRNQLTHNINSVLLLLSAPQYCAVVALRTLILCCCCSPHPNTVRSATIGHFTGQVVHGLGWGGGMAGSAGAVEGVGVGQVVQGLWRGRGWHCWPAARSLVGS